MSTTGVRGLLAVTAGLLAFVLVDSFLIMCHDVEIVRKQRATIDVITAQPHESIDQSHQAMGLVNQALDAGQDCVIQRDRVIGLTEECITYLTACRSGR